MGGYFKKDGLSCIAAIIFVAKKKYISRRYLQIENADEGRKKSA